MPRFQGVELQALLLDLDDTVLDGQSGLERSWRRVCEGLVERVGGVDAEAMRALLRESSDWFWADDERHRRGRLDMFEARRAIVTRALAALGHDDPELVYDATRYYCALRESDLAPFDGALEALARLRRRVPALGLVTNGASDAQRAKIDRFALAGFFDVIVVEGEFGAGKPERAVFEHATRALDAAPEASCMVGDNYRCDVLGALHAGLHAAWIEPRGRPAPEPAPRPHPTVRSLVEFERALET
ncbi:MAG: HAD family hydrolase [Myxococcota bacterium]|nr:HAD family hydrolase [Myxococcota bacterium]